MLMLIIMLVMLIALYGCAISPSENVCGRKSYLRTKDILRNYILENTSKKIMQIIDTLKCIFRRYNLFSRFPRCSYYKFKIKNFLSKVNLPAGRTFYPEAQRMRLRHPSAVRFSWLQCTYLDVDWCWIMSWTRVVRSAMPSKEGYGPVNNPYSGGNTSTR